MPFFRFHPSKIRATHAPNLQASSRKGALQKDENALKLTLQHWLEACESKEPFYWLDVGEGKEIKNLVEAAPYPCRRFGG